MLPCEHKILFVPQTSSTNSLLKEMAQVSDCVEFLTICADFQTAGRGQKENKWESESGKNLLFSVLIYPHFVPVEKQFILSQIVSLALKDTLDEYIEGVSIKWPNDIYRHDKKICGILIENTLSTDAIAYTIVGIGLNVNQANFESDAPNPVSMFQASGEQYDRKEIVSRFLTKLKQLYSDIQFTELRGKIVDRYKESLYRGRSAYYLYRDDNGVFEAVIHDVTESGYLILKHNDNSLHHYAFKEVQFIL